ncbi:hypothetical protein Sm713_34640 [Streptomyces sp. TS71-3]|nr:hypothetical protein Sm713_34640 [Streptomyces sp. TS71-3]
MEAGALSRGASWDGVGASLTAQTFLPTGFRADRTYRRAPRMRLRDGHEQPQGLPPGLCTYKAALSENALRETLTRRIPARQRTRKRNTISSMRYTISAAGPG